MHLALAMHPLLPSASSHGVGFSKVHSFAAQYPACTDPCQRFGSSSRRLPHDSGPARIATPSPCGFFIPLHLAGLARRTGRLCYYFPHDFGIAIGILFRHRLAPSQP
jgi:hypothetical protein